MIVTTTSAFYDDRLAAMRSSILESMIEMVKHTLPPEDVYRKEAENLGLEMAASESTERSEFLLSDSFDYWIQDITRHICNRIQFKSWAPKPAKLKEHPQVMVQTKQCVKCGAPMVHVRAYVQGVGSIEHDMCPNCPP